MSSMRLLHSAPSAVTAVACWKVQKGINKGTSLGFSTNSVVKQYSSALKCSSDDKISFSEDSDKSNNTSGFQMLDWTAEFRISKNTNLAHERNSRAQCHQIIKNLQWETWITKIRLVPVLSPEEHRKTESSGSKTAMHVLPTEHH